MQPVVLGQDLSMQVRANVGKDGDDWPHAKFWSIETYYLYTLLWDPFILKRTGHTPLLTDSYTQAACGPKSILLPVNMDLPNADFHVRSTIAAGGCVVLQHPSSELLDAIDGPSPVDRKRPSLVSLRERWDFGQFDDRQYYYPDRQNFLRLNTAGARVVSKIGGNADLMIKDRMAVWAGNVFHAVASYANMPNLLSRLMGTVACLLAEVTGSFMRLPVTEFDVVRMRECFDLRRDFHALGFAYLTVQELAHCFSRDIQGLEDVQTLAITAACKLTAGKNQDGADMLRQAFNVLQRINRTLQPKPAVFTDTLHGGELYPDMGYFELDWPQHPADVLRTYLEWGRARSYRFNVDIGASSLRELALRYPDLFSDLRQARQDGIVEFVNGTCNQPYAPLHAVESQIRQIDIGHSVWHELFGTPPSTYASQEYAFCPQMASVLAQQGYQHAVIRVQNMGDAPTFRHEQITWIAPNGDGLRSLPSHPHKSENLNWLTYNNLHLKIYLHQREIRDFAVFTCLGDISYHRHMREELARVCHYAPVFGSFETFSSYFEKTSDISAPTVKLSMQDFNCDAGFLNLDLWPIYASTTGDFISHCVRSQQASYLLAAMEMVQGIVASFGMTESAEDVDEHWEALSHYQGHGNYIVPRYMAGAFLGGINNPQYQATGHGVPEVAEYTGPFSCRTIAEVTGEALGEAERCARESLSRNIQVIAQRVGARSGWSVYNFAPARSNVISIPALGDGSLAVDERRLFLQKETDAIFAYIQLPAYGFIHLSPDEAAADPQGPADAVLVSANLIENAQIRVEFDGATGTIHRFLDKRSNVELMKAGSHIFYCPDGAGQRCTAQRIVYAGPIRGVIEMEIEIPVAHHASCRLRTQFSVDVGQSVLDIQTTVLEVPPMGGNHWQEHLGVKYLFSSERKSILTSHFNVMEPHRGPRLISPNLLIVRGDQSDCLLLNEGAHFYTVHDDTVSQILVVQRESARTFRYGIGCEVEYPLAHARCWQQPAHIVELPASEQPQVQIENLSVSESFFKIDSPAIEILSCRWSDGVFRVRMVNTSGESVRAVFSALRPIVSALVTTLDGENAERKVVADGELNIDFRPWDIKQLQVVVSAAVKLSREPYEPERAFAAKL